MNYLNLRIKNKNKGYSKGELKIADKFERINIRGCKGKG